VRQHADQLHAPAVRLRAVLPARHFRYLVKNGSLPEKVKSRDIYLGAIPWVILQLCLVVIVIFVPQTVTIFLDKDVTIDLDKVQIDTPKREERNQDQRSMDDLFKDAAKSDAAAPGAAPTPATPASR
jgi:hypothetical protein